MGRIFEEIDATMQTWLGAQHFFFVATAPLSGEGHVNLSPKGFDAFAVLGPRRVAYLDLVGSGAETIAHVRENGRITFLFCAMEGPARIVRFHGRGRVIEPGDRDFAEHRARFGSFKATRAIIVAELDRISDSCGMGVPLYTYEGDRRELLDWADRKDEASIRRYQREKNLRSIDGLPALRGEDL